MLKAYRSYEFNDDSVEAVKLHMYQKRYTPWYAAPHYYPSDFETTIKNMGSLTEGNFRVQICIIIVLVLTSVEILVLLCAAGEGKLHSGARGFTYFKIFANIVLLIISIVFGYQMYQTALNMDPAKIDYFSDNEISANFVNASMDSFAEYYNAFKDKSKLAFILLIVSLVAEVLIFPILLCWKAAKKAAKNSELEFAQ